MPDQRAHRGPGPADRQLFSEEACSRLREAVSHLSWLYDRGYAERSSLKLVGDRFDLTARQRMAVQRAACSSEARDARLSRCLNPPADMRIDRSGAEAGVRARSGAGGHTSAQAGTARFLVPTLHIDGFNVITTLEAALSGAMVLLCRDQCTRDLSGVHGSYRKVEETLPAIRLVRDAVAAIGCRECHWYLDRPVSNSGRLKTLLESAGGAGGDGPVPWSVHVVPDPDRILSALDEPVATADSAILDRCGPWVNLARMVIERWIPDAWVVRLAGDGLSR